MLELHGANPSADGHFFLSMTQRHAARSRVTNTYRCRTTNAKVTTGNVRSGASLMVSRRPQLDDISRAYL